MTSVITPQRMRRIILQQSKRANVGHIGSCLCVVEILCALYDNVLRIPSPTDPERDRFILSKGHAGLALYVAIMLKGWLSEADLNSFCGDKSLFGVHPESAATGVDFSTGSLGHGLSMAAGAAFAARLQGSSRRVFCLISDAECNEGSLWETAMFSAHHRLGRLTAILDLNGQQAFGLTRDVIAIPNLRERFEAFGWQVETVDGHSLAELNEALQRDTSPDGPPRLVIARTVFGKGVSFMEQGLASPQSNLRHQPINWHYLPMNEQEYSLALSELETAD